MNTKKGILAPLGLASSVAFAYAILFVALMLVSDKTITSDGVVLPAILIFLVISIVKYIFFKEDKNIPQWLVVGSFLIAIITAVVMTFIL
jgi:RsiW-degrading membrane proteinase PrsW (M82 family)